VEIQVPPVHKERSDPTVLQAPKDPQVQKALRVLRE